MPETETSNKTSKRDQILQQLKSTWENREAIQQQIKDTIQTTKSTVELTARALVEQSKTNPLVHEYITPLAEHERTEKVLNKLNTTFSHNRIFVEMERFRQELIDAKVSSAKDAVKTEPVKSPAAETPVTGATEKKSTKKTVSSPDETTKH